MSDLQKLLSAPGPVPSCVASLAGSWQVRTRSRCPTTRGPVRSLAGVGGAAFFSFTFHPEQER